MERIKITGIQRFSTHDGPGVRTVVFMHGCPLHCAWCHNPETNVNGRAVYYSPERCILCGACASVCKTNAHRIDASHTFERVRCTECLACCDACPTGALETAIYSKSVDEILACVERDQAFYGTVGGLTLSGGEPLLHEENALALLSRAKEAGLHTVVETCGFTEPATIRLIRPFVDLLLWDVKDTDAQRHRQYTGRSNALILSNLFLADSIGIPTLLRCIIVRGVNTDEHHYASIRQLTCNLKHCRGAELLPYHLFGCDKRARLGLQLDEHRAWIPTSDDLAAAKSALGSTLFIP